MSRQREIECREMAMAIQARGAGERVTGAPLDLWSHHGTRRVVGKFADAGPPANKAAQRCAFMAH